MRIPVRDEILACTRACEGLLASVVTLSDEERSLLEYYMSRLSQIPRAIPSALNLHGE
jgi:hypothetical protein